MPASPEQEIAERAEQMREDGASEEEIAQWIEASLANLDTHADPEPPFEVWTENLIPLQILQLAHFEVAAGDAGWIYTGVTTMELMVSMEAFEVPEGPPRLEMLRLLRSVIPEVCNARNRRDA